MSDSANIVDSVAVVLLCLAGFASTLLIFVAGSPQYGVLSTLWRRTGVEMLVGCSFAVFLVAALILRRMYRVVRPRPHGLLVFGVVSAIPFAFFMAILAARFVYGE